MSRWRLGLAITLTIVAVPLWIQAGEPDASAGPERVDAPGDPGANGYALLSDRSTAWNDLRAAVADRHLLVAYDSARSIVAWPETATGTVLLGNVPPRLLREVWMTERAR